MSLPHGFSWVDEPFLAGLARPADADDLHWLRQHGIQLLISLTEQPPPRRWVNEAGLFLMHVPVQDMEPPTQEQIDHCVAALDKARAGQMGAAVHCGAGLGRTGVILACWLVATGVSAQNAIARVRRLRPGSIETDEQAEAVVEFARRRGMRLNEG